MEFNFEIKNTQEKEQQGIINLLTSKNTQELTSNLQKKKMLLEYFSISNNTLPQFIPKLMSNFNDIQNVKNYFLSLDNTTEFYNDELSINSCKYFIGARNLSNHYYVYFIEWTPEDPTLFYDKGFNEIEQIQSPYYQSSFRHFVKIIEGAMSDLCTGLIGNDTECRIDYNGQSLTWYLPQDILENFFFINEDLNEILNFGTIQVNKKYENNIPFPTLYNTIQLNSNFYFSIVSFLNINNGILPFSNLFFTNQNNIFITKKYFAGDSENLVEKQGFYKNIVLDLGIASSNLLTDYNLTYSQEFIKSFIYFRTDTIPQNELIQFKIYVKFKNYDIIQPFYLNKNNTLKCVFRILENKIFD